MDVVVAGAGPSGARLAIQLASAGWKVTLVDPLRDPRRNAYSSAALPLDDAIALGLPATCCSASWQGWQLFDPSGIEHQWWSSRTLGVVLDFGELRCHLWDRARQAGVDLLSGWRVRLDQLHHDRAELTLQSADGRTEQRSTRCLVDATGARRVLLRQAGIPVDTPRDPLLSGEGVEWLIQADDRQSARWRDRLSFFLGTRWVRHGYGWVFPMADNRLKVGVCHLPPPSPSRRRHALGSALQMLLQDCGLADLPVLDRHGGVVSSTVQRREPLGRDALVCIGDAASTANLLGGEGIRHALSSADVLAEELAKHDGEPSRGLTAVRRSYARGLENILGPSWSISGRLARRTWWGLQTPRSDRRLSRLIHGLSSGAEARDLVDLLFRYRFKRYGWRLLRYLV